MNEQIVQSYAEFCEWAPTVFLVVSENVFDPLIYYSHILPVLLALPLAFIVFLRSPKHSLNQYLLLLVFLFSIWSLFDLILWAHFNPALIMFFWSCLILLEPLIYLTALFFAYYALNRSKLPTRVVAFSWLLILPTVIFLPTQLAIQSFNLTNCWREVTEGPLVFYGYIVQIFFTLCIIFYFGKNLLTPQEDNSGRYIVAGILLFLLTFSSGNILGSFFEDWTIGQYGLFGMPIMVAFIAFAIAKFKVFESKILSTELLVGSLCVLLLSLLLIEKLAVLRTVVILTFVLMIFVSTLLVRSVRKEVKQKEELEQLTAKLGKANKRLRELDKMKSEFVSIASHQLRSPLTSIRGYSSMLLDGSFGKLPAKATGAVERIAESSLTMASSVEDYLNVSRIEAGNMKYELMDFNLRDEAEKIADDKRQEAIKKGLLLTFKSKLERAGIVNADLGKTRQILHNLVNNALKYTPRGTIEIFVHDDPKLKRIYVDIIDSGIGIAADELEEVFGKFQRAGNANNVNVTGTGLGLFVAQKMAKHMGGEITAMSEGSGHGSTFRLELPLQM